MRAKSKTKWIIMKMKRRFNQKVETSCLHSFHHLINSQIHCKTSLNAFGLELLRTFSLKFLQYSHSNITEFVFSLSIWNVWKPTNFHRLMCTMSLTGENGGFRYDHHLHTATRPLPKPVTHGFIGFLPLFWIRKIFAIHFRKLKR